MHVESTCIALRSIVLFLVKEGQGDIRLDVSQIIQGVILMVIISTWAGHQLTKFYTFFKNPQNTNPVSVLKTFLS